ncbi:hypothetical protein HBI56_109780 [Parastagonospora nodorum]|uniref:Uncharacterized protein n=1 Tax=Phaeosphaeria nodorum (strain SN15 / ATCC MYA-4574 / FGSC 10173) TaxID=321614 RepID=A0A7U2HWH8_PHANO|nr:hypothetical protein HBH56_042330 [Parastagonospora nodorum]QRC92939.1 hypothetical protein JI435_080170 [Parastagonospora nodorum SN15]KAH3933021.1 hypothetical protein HBH54_070080 [Parastagonospora nodorum]KAH3943370.1 hypothetical protein HBH53_174250 [Parastagonospora nodorum]KAH3961846.1 hypothetical protein HBH52_229470 [Parastagonospora nodorum]
MSLFMTIEVQTQVLESTKRADKDDRINGHCDMFSSYRPVEDSIYDDQSLIFTTSAAAPPKQKVRVANTTRKSTIQKSPRSLFKMGNLFSSSEAERPEGFDAAESETSEHSSAPSDASSIDGDSCTLPDPRDEVPRSSAINQLAHLRNPFQVAFQAVLNKVQLLASRAHDAVANAVSQLRKLGVIEVAKEVGTWMKAHPAETAAIIVFIAVLASTPAILGAMGFTTAGIAAASTAAGIQSGIGSVAAGSVFAICQSAMMGGYGIFIFGALPTLSAALAWAGTAVWTWWKGSGSTEGEEAGSETDPDSEVALVKPEVPTMSIAKELATDFAQILKLGAIFVAATAVYRYRRWQNARRTDLDT